MKSWDAQQVLWSLGDASELVKIAMCYGTTNVRSGWPPGTMQGPKSIGLQRKHATCRAAQYGHHFTNLPWCHHLQLSPTWCWWSYTRGFRNERFHPEWKGLVDIRLIPELTCIPHSLTAMRKVLFGTLISLLFFSLHNMLNPTKVSNCQVCP